MAAGAMMCTWAVVVAGGSGTRFGRLKQLETLGDRRVLDWSVDALRPVADGIVVVAPPDQVAAFSVGFDEAVDAVVGGGASRSASVRAGLDALPPSATHVLVHDAARPLATSDLARRVVDAIATGASAAVPVVPVVDTLRTVTGTSVDRAGYVAVQTPQGFELDLLRRAHRSADVATDDATLVDRLGIGVVHVDGEATNLKITEPHDLRIAEALLAESATGHERG